MTNLETLKITHFPPTWGEQKPVQSLGNCTKNHNKRIRGKIYSDNRQSEQYFELYPHFLPLILS